MNNFFIIKISKYLQHRRLDDIIPTSKFLCNQKLQFINLFLKGVFLNEKCNSNNWLPLGR